MKLLSKTKEIFEAWAISFNPNDAQAELASKRIEICDVCEHKAVDPYIHCNQCGCSLKAKIYTPRTYKDSGGSCPKAKWKDVEDEYLKTKDVNTYNKLKSNTQTMEDNLLKRYAVEYFKKFRDKDLIGLSNIYADNIILQDWTGTWSGKQAVLDMNANFFESNFNIDIKSIEVQIPRAYVRFDLTIDNNTTSVYDSILFDGEYKIIFIGANIDIDGTN